MTGLGTKPKEIKDMTSNIALVFAMVFVIIIGILGMIKAIGLVLGWIR